jgi:predicted GNAT family acetyltransferase
VTGRTDQKEKFLADEVRDNAELHRFELAVDGRTAFSQYKLVPGTITFMHTEVPKELEGHGIGSKLVRGELEVARARGLKVVARCPFVAAYVEKHPEFQDLLA